MNIETYFSKSKLSRDQKKDLCMISICDYSKLKKAKRKPLNLSVAIDISGSMGWHLDGSYNGFYVNPTSLNPEHAILGGTRYKSSKVKLDLAKESLVNLIHNLQEDDILSVVAFDSVVDTVFEPTKINARNKQELIASISNLRARGATDLHSGWLSSVKFVAKNHSDEFINRVIVLSDGEITSGIREHDLIARDVLKISNENISTSTFGFGKDFDEDLLQLMSDSGAGNSYYVDDLTAFQEYLDLEFSGLTNTVGTLARMEFKPSKNVSLLDDFNQYKQDGDSYILPNLINKKPLEVLFEIKYKTKSKKSFKVGTVILSYKNKKGKLVTIEEVIKVEVCDQAEWEGLIENSDLKIKHVRLKLANDKEEAIRAMDLGKFKEAKSILQASTTFAAANADLSADIGNDLSFLQSNLNNDLEANSGLMRKSLSYSSYEGKRS